MTATETDPILAVDGGGTRCRIALKVGRDVTVVETGSANASSDFDRTVVEISSALSELAVRVNSSVAHLASIPAYVGLAGVTGEGIAKRLAAALPFTRVRVEDDRLSALRGALGGGDGFVAHCGTGSFVASQLEDTQRIVGGWGPILGDAASAQWVGRHALGYTLEASDGLRPLSEMAQHFLSTLGGTAGIVAFATTARPIEFGALAPIVTKHASASDPLAIALMDEAAQHLAHVLDRMGWSPGKPICLTGGIGPLYANHLPERMNNDLVAPLGQPLEGALSLAQDFSEEVAHERR